MRCFTPRDGTGGKGGGYGNFNNIFIAPRLVAGQKACLRLRREIVADNAPLITLPPFCELARRRIRSGL